MLHAMVMAGGGGTRFWPRSRAAMPKQFLTFRGDRTLLQGTLDRIEAQVPAEQCWVITSAAHRDEASRQLPGVPVSQVVGEPMGRDTAVCVGLGAALIARRDPDATIVVMPADHAIEPEQEFRRAVHAAEQLADDFPDALITFGIRPTSPATGYGYIHRGDPVATRQGVQASNVIAFREKPGRDVAEGYVASGDYDWNSGIFVWKARTILDELGRHKPALREIAERIAAAWDTPDRDRVFAEAYKQAEKTSIDFAVMEKASRVLVLQAPYHWDDVGSWMALERGNPQDAHENTVQADHVGIDTSGCVIAGEKGRLIATLGVSNLIIVQDGDATLIVDRRDEGRVKEIVELLKSRDLGKFL